MWQNKNDCSEKLQIVIITLIQGYSVNVSKK